jgi:prevent-host-death family protein
MEVSVSDAKGQLTELVRRAEDGEDIVLTRHGRPVARLQPLRTARRESDRRAFMEAVRKAAPPKMDGAVQAAGSQDFLYDEAGLPK